MEKVLWRANQQCLGINWTWEEKYGANIIPNVEHQWLVAGEYCGRKWKKKTLFSIEQYPNLANTSGHPLTLTWQQPPCSIQFLSFATGPRATKQCVFSSHPEDFLASISPHILSFPFNAMFKRLSHVWLFETPGTIACQAPLSMGFSRQEYWSGLPFPSPGDLPPSGIEPRSLESPALAGGFFITSAPCRSLLLPAAWNHPLKPSSHKGLPQFS